MARIQLLLLALLAASISVRAMSPNTAARVKRQGEVQIDFKIFLLGFQFYLK
jgi:hypothetical protein